jgi:hypothetical protein
MTTCRRCGGILFQDCIQEDGEELLAWHCLLCGEWADALILQHRAMASPPQPRNVHAVGYDPHKLGRWVLRWKAR